MENDRKHPTPRFMDYGTLAVPSLQTIVMNSLQISYMTCISFFSADRMLRKSSKHSEEKRES